MAVVSGVMDFSSFDTTPGANSLFAPLAGAQGSGAAYLRGMRKALQTNNHLRMLIGIAALSAMRSGMPKFTGPYATEAKQILEEAIQKHSKESNAA